MKANYIGTMPMYQVTFESGKSIVLTRDEFIEIRGISTSERLMHRLVELSTGFSDLGEQRVSELSYESMIHLATEWMIIDLDEIIADERFSNVLEEFRAQEMAEDVL